jgi:hypothetical protein
MIKAREKRKDKAMKDQTLMSSRSKLKVFNGFYLFFCYKEWEYGSHLNLRLNRFKITTSLITINKDFFKVVWFDDHDGKILNIVNR